MKGLHFWYAKEECKSRFMHVLQLHNVCMQYTVKFTILN